MAECVVTFLLNKLATLPQLEQLKLLRGVWGDVEYIRDELERMKAFLRVADAMEESDEELKVWVRQVSDVAYDTEDVLDEFSHHLAVHPQQEWFCGWLDMISFCTPSNWTNRLRIAYKMQGIKSRVINISEGHRRYRYRSDVARQECSSSITTAATNINARNIERRGDALLLDEAELVGINQHKSLLIECLVKGGCGAGLKVVSVVGMGGLGKTTLVKKVYDDIEVRKHFESHMWITVSQSFKTEELLKDMIRQLYDGIRQPVPNSVDMGSSQMLKASIKDFLQQRRYLLILDDVWDLHAWEALKYTLPNSNCDGRVLLTTRNVDTASTACKESHGNVYTLKPLSQEESWTLFCKKTFPAESCPSYLEGISKCILQRCEGLPLAIVAVSGVLSTKDGIDEWESVYRSLGAELEGNNKFDSLKEILLLSYNDLPYYLKSCFLYMSIFPEDYLIRRMRLIRLWMAEGFVEAKGRKTQEEVGEGYLNELVNRSLVQVATRTRNGRVSTCRVHDLLREIIVSKSRGGQNLVAIANEENVRWPEKIRRLAVHKTLENVPQDMVLGQLRSLLMFSLPSGDCIPTLSSGGLRLLKVLDLQGAPLEIIPNEVWNLFNLRYLSLSRTKVKVIPSSIGKLQNLETLDLKHSYVTELPAEILMLHQLRHLLLYRYEKQTSSPFHSTYGFKAPQGMQALSFLQKLCFVDVEEGSGVISEVGHLKQLRKLGIIKLRKEDGMNLCSSIEKLSNLRSLDVTSIQDDEMIDLQCMSSPPRFLQRLWLQGRLEKMPHWISSLDNLVKLRLRWSRLRDDPLVLLQALPSLVELQLRHAYEGESLCFKSAGFLRLNILHFHKLERLRRVTVEDGAMPRLERLGIFYCKLLEKVPQGIQFLTQLKSLDLAEMPNEFIGKLQDRSGEDYSVIEHIPDVRYTYWVNNQWKQYRL